MATFNDNLTILRRFLRDASAVIWETAAICRYWNQAAHEVAQKIGFQEEAGVIAYPPQWDGSYMHDWEIDEISGDVYRCLDVAQYQSMVVAYPWEAQYDNDVNDDNYRCTHPWEAQYADVADPIKLPLPTYLESIVYAAFDETEITPITEKELSLSDAYYRTTTGTPIHYWRPDIQHNEVVLYPAPSSVSWEDDASSFEDDEGLVTDLLETGDQLFMIYRATPTEVTSTTYADDITWCPVFVMAAIRAGTLERAFGADTDGFIPSLRDYWKMRKEAAIMALKILVQSRMQDRDIRLGGSGHGGRPPYPRLPDHYPSAV